jgi:hypothetical protein
MTLRVFHHSGFLDIEYAEEVTYFSKEEPTWLAAKDFLLDGD